MQSHRGEQCRVGISGLVWHLSKVIMAGVGSKGEAEAGHISTEKILFLHFYS